jgi:hypothetical protein
MMRWKAVVGPGVSSSFRVGGRRHPPVNRAALKCPDSHVIERAGDFPTHGPRQFGVDERGAHIGMAEELLYAVDVHAVQEASARHAEVHPGEGRKMKSESEREK